MVGWYLKVVDPVLARVWKVSSEKSTHDLLNWEVAKDAWVHEFHEKVYFSRFSSNIPADLRPICSGLGCSRF